MEQKNVEKLKPFLLREFNKAKEESERKKQENETQTKTKKE